MPVIFGRALSDWAIRIVLASLAFFLIKWLLPLLFIAIHFPIPDTIVTLIALAIALLVLFGNWSAKNAPS